MSLPANQLFLPLQKWPFPIPVSSETLPPHTGATESALRRWFYLMRYWELTLTGTFRITSSYVTDWTFSGTQVFPAQKALFVSDDIEGVVLESDELEVARDIWKGISIVSPAIFGCKIHHEAYEIQGYPWNIQVDQVIDVTGEDGDPIIVPPDKCGAFELFPNTDARIVSALEEPEQLYPHVRLSFDLSSSGISGLTTNHIPYDGSKPTVGQLVIDGTYTVPLTIVASPAEGVSYTGDVLATLNPKASGGFWAWGKLTDGTNPKWDVNTGEKIGDW